MNLGRKKKILPPSGKQMQLQREELCVIHNRFVDVMIYI